MDLAKYVPGVHLPLWNMHLLAGPYFTVINERETETNVSNFNLTKMP